MKEVKATVVNHLVELSKIMGMEISRKQAKNNAWRVLDLLQKAIRDINIEKNQRVEFERTSLLQEEIDGSNARIFIIDGTTYICTPAMLQNLKVSHAN